MSCEHATGTTLLWLYGEGPEDHLHHVAGCAACAEVVAAHEAVLAQVAPVLPAVAQVGEPEAEVAPSGPPPLRVVGGRPSRWAPAVVGGLALAALALLLVRFAGDGPEGGQVAGADGAQVAAPAPEAPEASELAGVAVADTDGAPSPADGAYVPSPFDSELDADLDDLELALDSLAHDLSTL